MKKLDELLKKEIYDLVSLGEEIHQKSQRLQHVMRGDDLATVSMWVTRLGQLIRRLYGTESQQYASYSEVLKTPNFSNIYSNWNAHISQLIGVAKAVQYDFESGLLSNIRSLLQADIFADFLDMAEHLLGEGYKDAAAVIIGTVLEDSMRKLCVKQCLSIENENGKPLTIEPLNSSLVKAGIYNKLIQKQITSWADLRNKAAHGHYSEYDKSQVQMMLLFVQKFASDYLV